MSWWMKRHRRIENVPTIKATEFAVQWHKWWAAMQPAWRLSDKIWPLLREAPATTDWSGLQYGGGNGFFLIILTLSWWAQAVQNDLSQEDFLSAVDDVHWVITQISMGFQTSEKRRNDDDEPEVSPKKR